MASRLAALSSLKTKPLSPEAAFAEELAIFASQGNPRRRPPTAEAFKRINLDKALSIYRDRFSDAGDFTFIFVGNLDLPKLKPLVETYLGSLPTTGRQENWRDIGITRPAGVQKKVIRRGTEPKSQISLSFHGPETYSPAAASDMGLLSEVLSLRLRETLRVEMGGVEAEVHVNLHIDFAPARALAEIYAGEEFDWADEEISVDFPEGRIHGFLTTPNIEEKHKAKWRDRVTKALRKAKLI